MVSLVACIGEGKGTWAHVAKLISDQEWENVYIITQEFFKDKFSVEKKNVFRIIVDENKTLTELVDELKKAFDGKFFGDVAVNLISGTGKIHMAILAALLKSGAGIRLVALTKEGIKDI